MYREKLNENERENRGNKERQKREEPLGSAGGGFFNREPNKGHKQKCNGNGDEEKRVECKGSEIEVVEEEGREGEGEGKEKGEVERGEVVARSKSRMIETEAVELSSSGVEGGGRRATLGGLGIGGTENGTSRSRGGRVGVDVGTEGVEREGREVEEVREEQTGHRGDEVQKERRDRWNVHCRNAEESVGGRLDPIRSNLGWWEDGERMLDKGGRVWERSQTGLVTESR